MAALQEIISTISFQILRGFSPLDAPESIKELALRPRIPKLLLLFPFSDFAAVLISLFRCITGVSAIGSVILAVPDGCGSGDTKPFSSSVFDLLGLPFLRFFSAGTASFRNELCIFSGCGSGSAAVFFVRVCRLGCSSTTSALFSSKGLLRGRPFLGDGFDAGFSGAESGTSGIASIDGLGFFEGRREN